MLRAVLHSPESVHGVSGLAIRDVFKTLQNDPEVDTDDLIELEWGFMPLLVRYHGASPKTIERRLADDPAFFCDVIRTVFRSKLVERPAEELTPQQRIVAKNAYRLLSECKTPPGIRKDGTYDGEAINSWLAQVKRSCTESGHVEIALRGLGMFSRTHLRIPMVSGCTVR